MNKKLLYQLCLVLALLLVATGCGGGEEEEGAATGTDVEEGEGVEEEAVETVQVAFQGPLTGDNAALGVNMVRGVELGIQDCNEELDTFELELRELDSQGSPDQAPALAQQAAADTNIVAVVGPAFSGETAASGPIYEEAGLPFISPSATNPELSQNGWEFFFRTVATDATQGPVAAKFIAENIGASQVAVVDDASEYGKGLADIVEDSLEELDVTVEPRAGIEAGGTDFSTVVGQVVQAQPDAIFYGGYFKDAGLLRRQLVESGGKDIVFVSDDGAFDQQMIDIAGAEAAEGAFVTFPGADPLSADPEFLNRFAEQFQGAQPGAFTIEAYQNTLLICEALKEAPEGATGEELRQHIRDFADEFSGEIFGKQIEFNDEGDIAAQTFFIYEVQDGKFTQQEEVSVEATEQAAPAGEPGVDESPTS